MSDQGRLTATARKRDTPVVYSGSYNRAPNLSSGYRLTIVSKPKGGSSKSR